MDGSKTSGGYLFTCLKWWVLLLLPHLSGVKFLIERIKKQSTCRYKTIILLHKIWKSSMAGGQGDAKVEVFDAEEDVAVALAKYIARLSDVHTKGKGVFTVVLSGGTLIDTIR